MKNKAFSMADWFL